MYAFCIPCASPGSRHSASKNSQPALYPRPSHKVPYILPSSVCSNSFLFTLFSKLPGDTEDSPIFHFHVSSFQSAGARGASCFSHESPVTNHHSLSPLQCAVPRFRLLTPLECAVTKTRSRKSFRMRSSKKSGGRGPPNSSLATRLPAVIWRATHNLFICRGGGGCQNIGMKKPKARVVAKQKPVKEVNELRVFDLPPDSPKVTAEQVRKLQAERR